MLHLGIYEVCNYFQLKLIHNEDDNYDDDDDSDENYDNGGENDNDGHDYDYEGMKAMMVV